jgi:hypothetical protein
MFVDRCDAIHRTKGQKHTVVGDGRACRARLCTRTSHGFLIGGRLSQYLDDFLH